MKERYLEVIFSHGKAFAAYPYLPRQNGERSVRSEEAGHGMVINYGPNDHPIGIELTAPSQATLVRLNGVLRGLDLAPMKEHELAPLVAAR